MIRGPCFENLGVFDGSHGNCGQEYLSTCIDSVCIRVPVCSGRTISNMSIVLDSGDGGMLRS